MSTFTIRKHTICLRGINKELPVSDAKAKLKELYDIILKDENLLQKHLKDATLKDKLKVEDTLSVEMIYDMNILMDLKDKIERNGLKNEFFKDKFLQEADEEPYAPGAVNGIYCRKVKGQKGCFCCKQKGYEVI